MINADVKPSLIDLEVSNITTGGKQDLSVQPERLSERDNMYIVYWIHLHTHVDIMCEGYVGITKDFNTRMKDHFKKSSGCVVLKNAIKKYGVDNLIIDIILKDLNLKEALEKENYYRPLIKIGWNSKIGGYIGNTSEWYKDEENAKLHKETTSIKTKEGIKLKDSSNKRSSRAKLARKTSNKFNDNKGSNNPRAKLTENEVCDIKNNYLNKSYTYDKIAEIFNVTKYIIWSINSGKSWSHVICDSPDHDK